MIDPMIYPEPTRPRPQTSTVQRVDDPCHVDLLRLDGRLYRVVGRTMIEGREHKVLAPVGRGPMRAVPCDDVPRETSAADDAAQSRRNTQAEHNSAGRAQEGRSSPPLPRQPRRMLTPTARLNAALWPRPGRIGCGPIFALVATLVGLTLAFG